MQTVQRGDMNAAVRALQYLIGATPDGSFGPDTEKRWKAFQAANGLPASGVCDAAGWVKLAGKQRVLCKNKVGGDVKAVQLIAGIPVSAAGLFGSVTDAVVRKLQAAAGLEADGKVGPMTWAYLLTAYKMSTFVAVQPEDFKQYDRRWAKTMYGYPGQTIRNSGCGPTAMADILAAWKDPKLTPPDVAAMAVKNGYCTNGHGTARAFFDWVAKKYAFSRYSRTYSTDEAIAALKGGAYVVALMGKGYWTGGGHYICCWKYEAATDRIYANDPASATRKSAVSKVFREQRKEYFIFCQ